MKLYPFIFCIALFVHPFVHSQNEAIFHKVIAFEADLEANQQSLQKKRDRLRQQYAEALTVADKTYRAASNLDAVMAVQELSKNWKKDPSIPEAVSSNAADLAAYTTGLRNQWEHITRAASQQENTLYTEHLRWIKKEIERLERKGQGISSGPGKILADRFRAVEKRHLGSAAGRFHAIAHNLRALLQREDDPEKSSLFPLEEGWINVQPNGLTVIAPEHMPIPFVTENPLPNGYAVELRIRGGRAGGLFSPQESGAAIFISAPKSDDWHTYRFEIVGDKVWGYLDGEPRKLMTYDPRTKEFGQIEKGDDPISPFNTDRLHPGVSVAKGHSADIEFIDTMRYQ